MSEEDVLYHKNIAQVVVEEYSSWWRYQAFSPLKYMPFLVTEKSHRALISLFLALLITSFVTLLLLEPSIGASLETLDQEHIEVITQEHYAHYLEESDLGDLYYDTTMSGEDGQEQIEIMRTGLPGAYHYEAARGSEAMFWVSYHDALTYCAYNQVLLANADLNTRVDDSYRHIDPLLRTNLLSFQIKIEGPLGQETAIDHESQEQKLDPRPAALTSLFLYLSILLETDTPLHQEERRTYLQPEATPSSSSSGSSSSLCSNYKIKIDFSPLLFQHAVSEGSYGHKIAQNQHHDFPSDCDRKEPTKPTWGVSYFKNIRPEPSTLIYMMHSINPRSSAGGVPVPESDFTSVAPAATPAVTHGSFDGTPVASTTAPASTLPIGRHTENFVIAHSENAPVITDVTHQQAVSSSSVQYPNTLKSVVVNLSNALAEHPDTERFIINKDLILQPENPPTIARSTLLSNHNGYNSMKYLRDGLSALGLNDLASHALLKNQRSGGSTRIGADPLTRGRLSDIIKLLDSAAVSSSSAHPPEALESVVVPETYNAYNKNPHYWNTIDQAGRRIVHFPNDPNDIPEVHADSEPNPAFMRDVPNSWNMLSKLLDPLVNDRMTSFFANSDKLDKTKAAIQESLNALTPPGDQEQINNLKEAQQLVTQGLAYSKRIKDTYYGYCEHNPRKAQLFVSQGNLEKAEKNVEHFSTLANVIVDSATSIANARRELQKDNLTLDKINSFKQVVTSATDSISNANLFGNSMSGENGASIDPENARKARIMSLAHRASTQARESTNQSIQEARFSQSKSWQHMLLLLRAKGKQDNPDAKEAYSQAAIACEKEAIALGNVAENKPFLWNNYRFDSHTQQWEGKSNRHREEANAWEKSAKAHLAASDTSQTQAKAAHSKEATAWKQAAIAWGKKAEYPLVIKKMHKPLDWVEYLRANEADKWKIAAEEWNRSGSNQSVGLTKENLITSALHSEGLAVDYAMRAILFEKTATLFENAWNSTNNDIARAWNSASEALMSAGISTPKAKELYIEAANAWEKQAAILVLLDNNLPNSPEKRENTQKAAQWGKVAKLYNEAANAKKRVVETNEEIKKLEHKTTVDAHCYFESELRDMKSQLAYKKVLVAQLNGSATTSLKEANQIVKQLENPSACNIM